MEKIILFSFVLFFFLSFYFFIYFTYAVKKREERTNGKKEVKKSFPNWKTQKLGSIEIRFLIPDYISMHRLHNQTIFQFSLSFFVYFSLFFIFLSLPVFFPSFCCSNFGVTCSRNFWSICFCMEPPLRVCLHIKWIFFLYTARYSIFFSFSANLKLLVIVYISVTFTLLYKSFFIFIRFSFLFFNFYFLSKPDIACSVFSAQFPVNTCTSLVLLLMLCFLFLWIFHLKKITLRLMHFKSWFVYGAEFLNLRNMHKEKKGKNH